MKLQSFRCSRKSFRATGIFIGAALGFVSLSSAHAAPNFVTVDIACTYPSGTAPQIFSDTFGGYQRAELFPASGNGGAITAGDFNGDSYPDVAFQRQSSGSELIALFNLGAGSSDGAAQFNTAAVIPQALPRAATLTHLLPSDLNNDGLVDLLSPYQSGGTLGLGGVYKTLFRIGGASTDDLESPNYTCYTPPLTSFPTCLGTESFAGAALLHNQDAFNDLVFLQRGARNGSPAVTPQILIYQNDGSEGFQPVAGALVDSDFTHAAVAVGDVSGDGKADIVYKTTPNARIFVLVKNNSGGYDVFGLSVISATDIIRGIAVADLNLDGFNDIVALFDAPTANDYLLIRLGAARGAFAPGAVRISVPSGPLSMQVGDLTGDAKTDIFVLSSAGALLLRNTNGAFGEFTRLQPALSVGGVFPTSCVAGDFQHVRGFQPNPNLPANPGGGSSNWGSLKPVKPKLSLKKRVLTIDMQRVQNAQYIYTLRYRDKRKTITKAVRATRNRVSVKKLPLNAIVTVSYVFESKTVAGLRSRPSPGVRVRIR